MSKVAEARPISTANSRFKTVWIKVADIVPTRDNTRNFEDPARQASLKELAESIKQKGLLQPIVVRPHPTKPGKYDLRAGERRWRAHKLAGLVEIEARVRKMSDLDAKETTFIENFEREQLTPMETAHGIEDMIKSKTTKTTLREIGEHLNMSVSMVLRRARLTQLIKPWQKAMEAKSLPNWSTAYYESLARFDAPAQEHIHGIVAEHPNRYNGMTLRQFEAFLAEQTHLLSLATWDLADKTLVPEAGDCLGCPYRSGCNPGLFDGLSEPGKIGKKELCLNAPCWEKKTAAMHERAKLDLLKKHPGLIFVSSQYYSRKDGVCGREDYEPAKKSEKGAVPAVWDDGEDRGKLFYAKPLAKSGGGSAKKKKAKGAGPMPLSDRREAYAKRRNVHVLNAFAALLEEGKMEPPALPILAACAAVFGTAGNQPFAEKESWPHFEDLVQGGEPELRAQLWGRITPVLRRRLKSAAMDKEPSMEEVERLAALLGTDLVPLHEAALKDIPDAKGWEFLNEDGSPKKVQRKKGG